VGKWVLQPPWGAGVQWAAQSMGKLIFLKFKKKCKLPSQLQAIPQINVIF
jgi:hypothetical protein